MTLEDFFTLTEMKNRLATSARVEELISMMQKQVDIVTSNTGDAARQWSIVAGTLAATDNKDCLHHFVQLNGVILLNQWLQEAIKCSDEAGDSSVEELVNALLGSLERLPIDNEKSIASGINITVQQLLCHKTCNIQEKAKILLDQWNCARVDDARCQITDTGDAPSAGDATKGNVMHPSSPGGSSSCKPKFEDTALGIVSADNEHGSKCSDTTQLENAGTLEVPISHVSSPGAALTTTDANAVSSDRNSLGSSHLSTSCVNNLARTGESSVYPAISPASTSTCNNIGVGRKVVDECNNQLDDGVNDENKIEVAVNTKGDKEAIHLGNCSISSSYLSQQKPLKESHDNFDVKENSSCMPKDAVPQVSAIGDDESLKYTRNSNDCQEKENEDHSFDCQGLSGKATINREIDVIETNCQLKEAFRIKDDTVKVDGTSNLKVNGVDVKAVEGKLRGVTDRPSDLELDCSEIDAVDTAQQEAIKVEHEVSNYREPSSKSPEISSAKIETDTFESLENEGQLPTKEQEVNEQPIGNDGFERQSCPMEVDPKVSKDLVFDPQKEDMASLKSVTIDKKPAGEVHACRLDFDLNADVADEENDCSMYPSNKSSAILSAPKAVVASKGTSGLPVTRLQFEGEMGWRGSAATSAFRPTSSQKTPDSSSGSKQKPACLGIDLNMTSEDGEAGNTTSVKQLPHSGFPSADSSIEVSSRRSERLNLDLNRLGDEEVSPYSSLNWRPLHKKADQSISPSSSSSSRVPSTRDFDLNDNPSIFGVVGSQNLNRSSLNAPGTCGSSKTEDPCITIMGSRMTVERKNYADQPSPFPSHQVFLGSGVNIGTNMATRTMMPYHMPSTAYGYNGIGMETAMPIGPIPSTLYGLHSTPYLVDSSGVKVIPQLLRTSEQNSSTPGAFHLGLGSDRPGWNTPESSEPALDLNFGMTSMESANRQPGSLKQFFGFLEEQATASQPESSGMSLKRKEPDSGWDSHPFSYKQVKSSWL